MEVANCERHEGASVGKQSHVVSGKVFVGGGTVTVITVVVVSEMGEQQVV